MIAADSALDVGVLILRLVLGLTLAAHGLDKFFGSIGIAGVAGWFESAGVRPGRFNAVAAAATETVAGIALAAGLLTPLAAAGFVAVMLVAVWTVHRPNGFFVTKGGWEYNLVLAGSAVGVATIGSGGISLDAVLFGGTGFAGVLYGWWGLLIAVVLGLAGGLGQLILFYRPPPKPTGD